ncbi:hypothetical protein [Flavobacterium granuli]|uniref:Lipoprotein n=1 Tax=Flavobacterium granuli TaxID=280093 RepID=A0ABU1S4F1_9FLAO|nr:hypothetical protein [Flavobacterium granuli]MDR6845890.1 hypothetical protein [Flavobacterium granuli]
MMKYLFGIALLFCFSCGNKEDILLPKADRTIVKEVVDLSPIYIFFRVKGKDTLAEVNRKNSIGTTNWVLNIDKRLPLRLVVPEVIKLQDKKRGDTAHKNEAAQNYYSYADSIGKNLAFIPFTNVYYKMGKPKNGIIIYFAKEGTIKLNNELVLKNDLKKHINNLEDKSDQIRFCFDRNSSYGNYVQQKVFVDAILKKNAVLEEEFIY